MKRLVPWTGRTVVVVLFAILSGLLVVEARGLRFDWRNLRFVQTGSLVVRFNPEDAQLLVEGVATNKSSPIIIPELLPGRYQLELRHTGYTSWEKTVTIEPERVVAEIGVALFLTDPLVTPIVDSETVARYQAVLSTVDRSAESLIHNERELWHGDQLITRLSKAILQATWLVEGEFVVFQQGREIRLIATDGSNERTLYIATVDNKIPMIVERGGKSIVIEDTQGIQRITIQ